MGKDRSSIIGPELRSDFVVGSEDEQGSEAVFELDSLTNRGIPCGFTLFNAVCV